MNSTAVHIAEDESIIGKLRKSILDPPKPEPLELPPIGTPKAKVDIVEAIRPVELKFDKPPVAAEVRQVSIPIKSYGHFRQRWNETSEAEIYHRPTEDGIMLVYDGEIVEINVAKPKKRRLREWVISLIEGLKFLSIMAMFGAAVVIWSI